MEQEVLGKSDIEKAKFFLKVREVDTAAKWAGCAFEEVIIKRCRDNGIPLKNEEGKEKRLSELVDEPFVFLKRSREELRNIVRLRNKASHHSKHKFSFNEVKRMIDETESLKYD